MFLVLAMIGVVVWARRTFSTSVAAMAVAAFAMLPPILGHSSLVTTDMAVVAALPWALIALGDATWIFMKLFVPYSVAERLAKTPLPAASLPVGLAMVRAHNQSETNISFLGGEIGGPWPEYFPIVLFYKTPIPFLILFACGLVCLRGRRELAFALIPFAILAVAMTSRINIGVRHVLPIYVPASIIAAVAVSEIWKRATSVFSRAALAALLAWLVAGVVRAHPDHLACSTRPRDPSRGGSSSTAISSGARTASASRAPCASCTSIDCSFSTRRTSVSPSTASTRRS